MVSAGPPVEALIGGSAAKVYPEGFEGHLDGDEQEDGGEDPAQDARR
jgi:hypothetical protein